MAPQIRRPGRGQPNHQRNTRALLTGYLLSQLVGDKRYRDFADAAAELPNTSLPAADGREISELDRVQSLLK